MSHCLDSLGTRHSDVQTLFLQRKENEQREKLKALGDPDKVMKRTLVIRACEKR